VSRRALFYSRGPAPVEAGEEELSVVEKSVLVGYSAQQMFDLVDTVEAYPQFLPWCDGAEVLHRDAETTRATLHINYHGITQKFTTENTKTPPREMTVRLVEGPFRILDGAWRFTALAEHACRIEFRLRYEFSSRILEMLVGPVFSYIANTMVDAFVTRAEKVYGG
jgi:ribosome-associated toxin RatA of RatAB toxin-antitoxin module